MDSSRYLKSSLLVLRSLFSLCPTLFGVYYNFKRVHNKTSPLARNSLGWRKIHTCLVPFLTPRVTDQTQQELFGVWQITEITLIESRGRMTFTCYLLLSPWSTEIRTLGHLGLIPPTHSSIGERGGHLSLHNTACLMKHNLRLHLRICTDHIYCRILTYREAAVGKRQNL